MVRRPAFNGRNLQNERHPATTFKSIFGAVNISAPATLTAMLLEFTFLISFLLLRHQYSTVSARCGGQHGRERLTGLPLRSALIAMTPLEHLLLPCCTRGLHPILQFNMCTPAEGALLKAELQSLEAKGGKFKSWTGVTHGSRARWHNPALTQLRDSITQLRA